MRRPLIVLGSLLLTATALAAPSRARSSSIAASDRHVVVVNPDSGTVTILDASTIQPLGEVHVGDQPQSVALSANGRIAFVASTGDGTVAIVDVFNRAVVRKAEIGVEPTGIIVDGDRLFVADHGADVIRILDAVTLAAEGTIAVGPMPRALTLDAERRRLYVTLFRSAEVKEIEADALTVLRTFRSNLEHSLAHSIAVADGEILVPLSHLAAGNTNLSVAGTIRPELVVHFDNGNSNVQIFLDDGTEAKPGEAVNVPRDVVMTSTRKIFLVHAGSDKYSVYDPKEREHRGPYPTNGFNPNGVALSPDEGRVYVNNALSGSISVIDGFTEKLIHTVPVTRIPLRSDLLNGKILFHTAARPDVAQDHWISCVSCHPDGGADGFTWHFPDGPRNTTSLIGVAETLPLHWSGDLDELQDVESTVRVIQFGTGLAEGASNCDPACDQAPPNARRSRDLDDLAAYIASLRPPRRVYERNDATRRGEAVFNRAGCGSCHVAPLYTDRKKHDVGTGGDPTERKGGSFDTPTLRGLRDTAPYMHDGRAATLRDVVDIHGNTATLSTAERNDLAAFLANIPFQAPKRRAVGR